MKTEAQLKAQLKAQEAALVKLRAGFNASASVSRAAADAFNEVPQSDRLKEVQAIVPKYNAIVAALTAAGQSLLGGISAVDKELAALQGTVVPPPSKVWTGNDELPLPVGVVPFDVVQLYPTFEQLSLKCLLNRKIADGTRVTAFYRLQGNLLWREALEMPRNGTMIEHYVGSWPTEQYFGGCIFDLAPGSTYQVLLTCTEPGKPTTSIAVNAVTRAHHRAARPANKFAKPGDDLNAIINGLIPGDVLQLNVGMHQPPGLVSTTRMLGTLDNPVYIRGQSRTETIWKPGPREVRVWQMQGGATGLVIENMTMDVRGTPGVRCLDFWDGAPKFSQITVRDCIFFGTTLLNSVGYSEGVLIQNCTSDAATGKSWEKTVETNGGWNDTAVRLSGPGHCVSDCEFTGHGDTIKHTNGLDTHARFMYRTKVTDCLDDLYEFDDTNGFCAVYDILATNTATAGSMDYTGPGPYYTFRVQAVNVIRGPLKLNSTSSNFYIFNCTWVKRHGLRGMYVSGGPKQDYYGHRNNIFVFLGEAHFPIFEWDSGGHMHVDLDYNAFFPDGPYQMRDYYDVANLAAIKDYNDFTEPHMGESRMWFAHSVALERQPFTTELKLTDDTVPYRLDELLTLKPGSPALGAGVPLPNITDGYTGAGPDMGARITGLAPRVIGYGGSGPAQPVESQSAAPTPVPSPAPAPAPTASWSKIADEGQQFTVPAGTVVRYGSDANWVSKPVSGNAVCSNEFFGRDPLVGTVKSCQAQGVAPSPPPPPGAPPTVPVTTTTTPTTPSVSPVVPPSTGASMLWRAYNRDAMPGWRKKLKKMQYKSLQSIQFQETGRGQLLNSWCGMAAVDEWVFLGPLGGHGDGDDNAMRGINLLAEEPKVVILTPASAEKDRRQDMSTYLDGTPPAQHSYWAPQGNAAHGRVLIHGGGGVTGVGWVTFPHIIGWDVKTHKWDKLGTWGDAVGSGIGMAQCQDYTTGDVYSVKGKWESATAKVTRFFKETPDYALQIDGYYAASCFDAKRQRFILLNNTYRKRVDQFAYYDLDLDKWVEGRIDCRSTAVSAPALLNQAQDFAFYHPLHDKIYIKRRIGSEFLEMDPETFVVIDRPMGGAVPPDAANSVLGRMVPIPSMGGNFYYPDGNREGGFLATED